MHTTPRTTSIKAPRALFASILPVLLAILLISCEDIITPFALEDVRVAALPVRKLTMQPASDGTASPAAGDLEVKDGEPLSISATADAGFEFLFWEQVSGAGTVTFDDETSASTIVRVTGGDAIIKARIDDNSFIITVTTQVGGTVSQSSLNLLRGIASDPVSAVSGPEYNFTGWTITSGLGVTFTPNAMAPTATISADAGDASIQANYALKTYTLTMTSDTGGYTTPGSSTTVTSNTARNIIASPYLTYAFNGWTKVSGTGIPNFADVSNANTTVTITGGPVTLKANYRKENLSLVEVGAWSQANSTSPMDVIDATVIGDYIYWIGYSSGGNGVVRRVDISTPGNPISSSSDYKTISGIPRGIARSGTSGSEVIVVATSTTMYKVAESNFNTTGFTTVATGMKAIRSDGLTDYFWGINAAGTAALYQHSTLTTVAYALTESDWSLEDILPVSDGLLAVGEDNGFRSLFGFQGPEGGGPVSASNSSIPLYLNGDMYGGIVGRMSLEPDGEYLSVPIYEDDQYLRLKTYDITSLSSLDGALVSSLDIGSDTDYAMGSTYDDLGSHYAYVAGSKNDNATIWIVDLSSISSPSISGGAAKTIAGFARAVEVFKRGNYLYVLVDADVSVTQNASLKVFRIDSN
ncbi:MAG: hypothetical protein A2Y38_02535 [Spirochaetes bacterium GWB1_59_5]|nr:MAG: hypothetical protein A2Y38_02535 [Spirochaetes bacterium GWB1_59_5]